LMWRGGGYVWLSPLRACARRFASGSGPWVEARFACVPFAVTGGSWAGFTARSEWVMVAWGQRRVKGAAVRRNFVALVVVALSVWGALVATSAAPADAAGECAGMAYVANSGDNTVSVITTATGVVSAPIHVGKGPDGVAVTPDGRHVYVANHQDGTVSVITTATGVVSAPITVGKGPVGVAVAPDGKHVYVANSYLPIPGVGQLKGFKQCHAPFFDFLIRHTVQVAKEHQILQAG
jgi:YVTN family beta-propeller protein